MEVVLARQWGGIQSDEELVGLVRNRKMELELGSHEQERLHETG